MRSKVSRGTLGVWGSRGCSIDVSQPFANPPQPLAAVGVKALFVAVPPKSSAKVVTFEGFKPRANSFRMARAALGDISG